MTAGETEFHSQPLQERVRLGHPRKHFLFRLELRRVHASPAPTQSYRMLQMQHLVVDDVLQHVARHLGMIEYAADDDRVVRRIVVAQDAARLRLAPAHARPRHQPVKEARVQLFKHHVQIVEMTACRAQQLASANLTHEMCLAHNVVAADIFSIACRMSPVDGLPVHLRQKDVCDRPQHSFGCAFQQIRESHQEFPVAQANGVVHIGERKEIHFHLGHRRPGTQFPVCFLEKFEHAFTHGERRLTGVRDQGLGVRDQGSGNRGRDCGLINTDQGSAMAYPIPGPWPLIPRLLLLYTRPGRGILV